MGLTIGIDTGGTFTDFVCFAGRRLFTHKRLSTPDDPARAVLAGIAALLERIGDEAALAGAHVTYGSTVATNALLERKGARVALLTTAGFEDLLEIGRQTRPVLYTLEPRLPSPLVARAARVGVEERVSHAGHVLTPLDDDAVGAAVARARRAGADSIAVCFLHSYANPAHERQVGRAVRAAGLECSLSSELVREYREYERLSTTVINAFVAPVMRRHLAALRRGLRRATLRVMQSSGGATAPRTAAHEAVRTLLSGPAGGVIGARAAAARAGIARCIALDMGGTSTDVSLVDGAVRRHSEWTMADLPVRVPAVDIHTVGAGGGSLARADAGGALKVGPASAGADPGPACYGRGTRPTVTDANVVLGRLAPDAFLGGEMTLDADRARRAVAELARSLGLDLDAAAEGIVQVVNAGMERAIRRISVERGHDPREYALVAFGGAGGMHACELAEALGIRRVLLPAHPGLLSASGAVAADLQRDAVQTVRLTDPTPAALERHVAPLRTRVARELRRDGGGGRPRLEASLDVRYAGQSYEVQVPMTPRYRQMFHREHEALYGYADPERAVEVVNVRVVGTLPPPAQPHVAPPRERAAARPHRVRWRGRWLAGRRPPRAALPARGLAGPLLLTELSATAFVAPGWRARPQRAGDVLLTRAA